MSVCGDFREALSHVRKICYFSDMGTAEKISDWIAQRQPGDAFSTADVITLGTRSSLDKALSRMVIAGQIDRIARGIFVVPKPNSSRDDIDPVACVLTVLSRRNGCPIQVSGDVALRRFGLSAEKLAPERSTYSWSAKSRKITVIDRPIHLRSVSPRKLALCGRTAGLAITAIWQIGKQEMTPSIMTSILNGLENNELAAIRESASALPTWALKHMADIEKSGATLSDDSSSERIAPPRARGTSKPSLAPSAHPTAASASGDANAGERQPSPVERRWSGFGPYYAMFPVEFAHQVISEYCPPGGKVLDPFCGRGTVPFVALATGREALGSDINPVAWVYAKTKTDPHPDPKVLMRRAQQIQSAIKRKDRRPENEFQELAWSEDVLAFLNAARRHLNWRGSRIDRTLMGVLLVHLHAKLGNGFSNQIRQSKAMAPEYSVRWWREKQMLPPEIDMLELLEEKLQWRYKEGIVPTVDGTPRPTILLGDSRKALRRSPAAFKADLILTSPPYCGVTNYRYDNWIRLWLLGEGPSLPESQTWARHANQDEYRDLLTRTFSVCKTRSDENVAVYVRTDARQFTLETTIKVLQAIWPEKILHFAFDGFKKATQTALFGDKSAKPGEVDLLLLSPDRPCPPNMERIEYITRQKSTGGR